VNSWFACTGDGDTGDRSVTRPKARAGFYQYLNIRAAIRSLPIDLLMWTFQTLSRRRSNRAQVLPAVVLQSLTASSIFVLAPRRSTPDDDLGVSASDEAQLPGVESLRTQISLFVRNCWDSYWDSPLLPRGTAF
jgi:hypothetical protein